MRVLLDKVGMSVSAICAVHCLLSPILASTSVIFAASGHDTVHDYVLMATMVASVLSMLYHITSTKERKIVAIIVASIAAISVPMLLNLHLEALTAIGSFGIVYGHYLSHKQSVKCNTCGKEEETWKP